MPNNTTWQPSVPNVTITDAGSRPTGITSYVQGKAKAKVVSSSAGQGGASISSYRVVVSGIGTYYGSNVTSGFLISSGTVTITVRATDSRGYYREKASTVTVVPYSPPKLTSYTALRSPNDQGTDLATSINFSISSVGDQNTKQYRIRYKPAGGAWVSLVDSTAYYARSTTHSATDALDMNSSYEVEFYIKDSYTSVTRIRRIGTAFQLLDFNASGRGVAFGKVSEGSDFEVALPAKFTKGIAFLDTRDEPAAPENVPGNAISFEFKFNNSVGNPPVTASPVYSHIINVAGWSSSEGSGGWPTQMSVSGGGIAVRQATSTTTWGPWKDISSSTPAWSAITGKPAQATRWPAWAEVTSKPSTFAPSGHNHSSLNTTSTFNRSATPYGYIDIGPANTGYAHIYTDRPSFYFNKELLVNGNTVWNGGNSYGSNGENGYIRLGNGQMIQWGSMTSAANLTAKAFTFPTAFPSACYIVVLQPTSHYGTTYRISAKSRTGATMEHALSNTLAAVATTVTYKWIAIGA